MTDVQITANQLVHLCVGIGSDRAMSWGPALDNAAAAYDISTPRRIRHWMAQLCTETGGFTRFEENLNYHADRLVAVWPSRFPSVAAAAPYAGNPQALANKVYGGRGGNIGPSDGWLYRGRGPIQRTFRNGYKEASDFTGVDLLANPERVLEPAIGAMDAAGYWSHHGCNDIADENDGERCYANFMSGVAANEDDNVTHETRVVNGGLIGLADRKGWLLKCATYWPD